MATSEETADRKLPRFSYLSLVALVLVIAFGLFADRLSREAAENELRTSVREQIGLIRAKLEGNINGNIHIVQGLISTLKTEPDMGQERFAELAGNLFTGNTQLRNVAAARDLVISLMYPMQGNERAIGLDYRANAAQRDAALRVRDEARLLIAGPVELVQGGQAFIARFPVFTGSGENRNFWGIVSAVIDVGMLYADSGLLNPDLTIDIALIGQDSLGARGAQFFGPQEVLANDPVIVDVILPGGLWQLAAVPKTGWQQSPQALWAQRLIIALAGFLILLPIVIAGRLSEQRKQSVHDLQIREDRLQQLSQRLELALDASRVGVWEFNLETGKLVWDDRMRELYGIAPNKQSVTVDDWRNALHPDDRDRAEQEFQEALNVRGPYRSVFRVLHDGGKVRHIRTRAAVYDDAGGLRIVGLNWDVTADVKLQDALKQAKAETERRNTELEDTKARIEHMAMHDSLTGLPNRRFLDIELSRSVDKTETAPQALLIVDLDRFKQINDTFGHAAGDALLVHVADILRSLARPGDFVARIGGDEFVILCRHDTERQHLTMLAQSIVARMQRPMIYEGNACRFGVSVGISTAENDAEEISRLLVNADLALYEAKSTGRNRFAFFTLELQAETLRTKKLADDILRGIEEGEFVPYYQPQYDAQSHLVTGVEALARWQHPELGLLTPAHFLAVAEEFNATASIDREILRQTLTDMDRWARTDVVVPRASVNVSAQRLQDPELLERLEAFDITPGRLSFELVESIFLDDGNDIHMENIERIKALGIDIEIDDFGSGRTSIISLLKVNPRRLKIDRQLIIPMLDSKAPRKLVRSVIEIGKSLDIVVVAEGVESMRHAQMLKRMGCDVLQGHAFGEPMPADQLARHIAKPVELTA